MSSLEELQFQRDLYMGKGRSGIIGHIQYRGKSGKKWVLFKGVSLYQLTLKLYSLSF